MNIIPAFFFKLLLMQFCEKLFYSFYVFVKGI